MTHRLLLLAASGILLLSGCDLDVETITAELEDVGTDLGLGEDEAPVVTEEPKPEPLPEVPEEHIAILRTMLEEAPNRLKENGLTDIGPAIGSPNFHKWRYRNVKRFKFDAQFKKQGEDLREVGHIDFRADCFRNPLSKPTRAEAAQSRVDEAAIVQLTFRVYLEFVDDNWRFESAQWSLSNVINFEPFEADTSHYRLCQLLFPEIAFDSAGAAESAVEAMNADT